MDGVVPAFLVIGLYVLIRTWRSGSIGGPFGVRGARSEDHPGLFWMQILISAAFALWGSVATIVWLV
jgi:hypothetical protein